MGESDNRTEVLKEIRDEIRGVRSELAELRDARLAAPGVRTEVVDRASRWRITAMASTGALAVVALVLALRAGPRSVPAPPAVAAPSPLAMTPAPAAAVPSRTPAALPPAPVVARAVASKPAAKSGPRLTSAPAAPPVKKRTQVEPLEAAVAAPDDGDTIPFPPPRRVRVHKMSYGPVESEPAKL
jgi:hypothetical protein